MVVGTMLRNNLYLCFKHTNSIKCTLQKQMSTTKLTNVIFENGIKKITMCNPKSRNTLSLAMMQDLLQYINEDVKNPELRVIVLASEGAVFSAGHNLKELDPDVGRPQQEQVFGLSSQLMYSIIDCPVPIIAQIDGLATASGCQLVTQCDIAICTERSSFSTPGASVGIFCSTPGIPLARKVLKSTALHMLLTGLPITAQEAKSSGLVSTVCSVDNLEKEVEKTCEAIKSKSRAVIELGKKFYYKQVDLNLKTAYALGAVQMVDNLQIKDGKEGVKSFVEKRQPVWSHQN